LVPMSTTVGMAAALLLLASYAKRGRSSSTYEACRCTSIHGAAPCLHLRPPGGLSLEPRYHEAGHCSNPRLQRRGAQEVTGTASRQVMGRTCTSPSPWKALGTDHQGM
jgi:hypothetical protein